MIREQSWGRGCCCGSRVHDHIVSKLRLAGWNDSFSLQAAYLHETPGESDTELNRRTCSSEGMIFYWTLKNWKELLDSELKPTMRKGHGIEGMKDLLVWSQRCLESYGMTDNKSQHFSDRSICLCRAKERGHSSSKRW